MELLIRLQPRGRSDEIVGERAGRMLIRVTAPPVDRRANEALCRLIAKRGGVPRGRVAVVRGQRSRDKTVSVEDAPADLRTRLLGKS